MVEGCPTCYSLKVGLSIPKNNSTNFDLNYLVFYYIGTYHMNVVMLLHAFLLFTTHVYICFSHFS